jgi:uncharacterized repeat protein (TIGR01451 family)
LRRLARAAGRVLAGLALSGGLAHAAITVNKGFTPNSVSAGQPSTLTIVFLNPNPAPATAAGVTDTLPANVVVAGTPNASSTCGGTLAAAPGATSVTLTGATVPAAVGATAGPCQLSVGVGSAVPGSYINTIPADAATSSAGTNSQPAQATLVVSALASVTGSKTMVPGVLHGGGAASALTITLTNPNSIVLTNAALKDALPAGVVLANPPNAATTCGAGSVTAVAGGSALQLAGGAIPANGSCTLTASLVAADPDTFVNTTRTNSIPKGALTTSEGVSSNLFSDNVVLQTGVQVVKAFAPATINSDSTSQLTITVRNFNGTALAGVSFTDTLPAGMTLVPAASTGTSCGGTLTATPGSSVVTLAGGSVAAAPKGQGSSSCAVTVTVTASNAGAAPITLSNSIPAGTFGTATHAAASANLVVNPAANITGTKSFPGSSVQTSSQTATITLSNASSTPAAITSITDDLTTMGTGFTVRAAPGGSCGVSMTSVVGATLFTASGGTIPATGSCTITLPIAIAADGRTGNRTNTIAAGGVQTSQGSNLVPIAGTNTVVAALTVSKSWTPATIAAGAVSRATVTLNHNSAAVPLTNVAFTDTLPVGHTVAAVPNAATTCGGSVTATPGAAGFALSGGSLGAGGTSCSVSVNVQAPATAGASANALGSGSVTAAEGVSAGDATATLTRVLAPVTVNASFAPTTVAVGGTSTLAIELRNDNPNAIALTGAALTNVLPVGMVLANPANLTFTGNGAACSGTLTSAGGDAIMLTGGSIAAGAVCTITATVQASAAGNLIDTVAAGAVSSAQGVTNNAAAAATLASTGAASLHIGVTDGVTSVVPGTTTTYTISLTNNGPDDVAGVTVTSMPPAGVTFTGWTCTPPPAGACTMSGSGAINDTASVPRNGTLVYTVQAAVAGNATGSIVDTVTLGVPGSVVDDQPVSASDTDVLTPVVSLDATLSDGSATYTPGGNATYVASVTNGGPSSASAVSVLDALPAGVVLTAPATCTASTGASCGSVTGAAGDASAGTSGATIPAGGMLTFTLSVAFAPALTTPALVDTVLASDAGTGASAQATDTDARSASVALGLTLSDGSATYTPGRDAIYVATVGNAGPSDAHAATVVVPLPAGVILAGIPVCSASGAAACGAVTGAPGDASATMSGGGVPAGAGNRLMLVLPVAFASSLSADPLVVGASAADPGDASPHAASDSDARAGIVALDVAVTDGSASYTPGGMAVITVTLTNAGPSDADDVTLVDPLPAGVTLAGPATCAATGAAACGTVAGTTGDPVAQASGGRLGSASGDALILTLPVRFAPSMTADPLVNTANAIDAACGATASGADRDARSLAVSLAVTVADGSATYQPGGNATYTVTVTNGGVSDALDVAIADSLPPGVTLAGVVSCSAAGNAACGAVAGTTGATAFGATGARIGAGSGNAVVLAAPVTFAPSLVADPLVDTASATDAASGASGSGSDSDARNASVNLAVALSDGASTYTPGTTATYVAVVRNGGASDALDVTVQGELPAGVILDGPVSCSATAGASCGTVSGTTAQARVSATGARIGAGGAEALTLEMPVRFAAALAADPLIDTITATDQVSGASGSANDADARAAQIALAITLSDSSATFTPGGSAVYTVVVTNAGPSDANALGVDDILPNGVTLAAAAQCSASGSATCGLMAGSIGGSAVTLAGASLPAGAGNAITLRVPVRFSPALMADELVNQVAASDAASPGVSAGASDTDTRLAPPPPPPPGVAAPVDVPLGHPLALLCALALALLAARPAAQRRRR